MDCNGVAESDDPNHIPFKKGSSSIHNDLMHSYGHDGHAAIDIGTAEILMQYKDSLRGKVILVFQAAKEGDRGAKSYIGNQILNRVPIKLSKSLWKHLYLHPYIFQRNYF